MKIEDIAKVRTRYLTGESAQYCNDPELEIILKRDRRLIPWKDFRWRQYGQLFVAIEDHEVHYLSHDRNDHNGFGWAKFDCHMVDDYDSAQALKCSRTERDFGNGSTRTADCHYDSSTNTMHLVGPWHCGAAYVEKVTGVAIMDVAVLEGPSRESIRNPEYYNRTQRRGRAYEGCMLGTAITVELAREIVDTLAPHLELWLGDYGWTVKYRDMPPKNARKRPDVIGHPILSAQQTAVVYR